MNFNTQNLHFDKVTFTPIITGVKDCVLTTELDYQVKMQQYLNDDKNQDNQKTFYHVNHSNTFLLFVKP